MADLLLNSKLPIVKAGVSCEQVMLSGGAISSRQIVMLCGIEIVEELLGHVTYARMTCIGPDDYIEAAIHRRERQES